MARSTGRSAHRGRHVDQAAADHCGRPLSRWHMHHADSSPASALADGLVDLGTCHTLTDRVAVVFAPTVADVIGNELAVTRTAADVHPLTTQATDRAPLQQGRTFPRSTPTDATEVKPLHRGLQTLLDLQVVFPGDVSGVGVANEDQPVRVWQELASHAAVGHCTAARATESIGSRVPGVLHYASGSSIISSPPWSRASSSCRTRSRVSWANSTSRDESCPRATKRPGRGFFCEPCRPHWRTCCASSRRGWLGSTMIGVAPDGYCAAIRTRGTLRICTSSWGTHRMHAALEAPVTAPAVHDRSPLANVELQRGVAVTGVVGVTIGGGAESTSLERDRRLAN
jgi:hypothetical protein